MSAERIRAKFEASLSDFAWLDAKVAFDLGEDGAIAIDATVSPPVLSDQPDCAHCTFLISTEYLEGLIDGTVNPMLAFTLGRLKVEGSLGVAMKVAALLED